ncbi:hypothetical protein [Conexibacter sp. CPCC 206217]|uniref:hypothetical protein n=1 Tax=Conexibacter sp. CPCC 206217 TaxID=3064574 RepID=UPI002719057A|nr:hypothetical protein [Conexibacter sp. CPCC 206217]MDO8213765.1 hypothetical protein [Conexibacter sp. CPCC 206217]
MGRVHRGAARAVATVAAAGLMSAGMAGAAVAAQAPAASGAAPALATGSTPDGRAAFRLEGDRLTVTLRRRLAPRRSGTRPAVTAICGADLTADRSGTRAAARPSAAPRHLERR